MELIIIKYRVVLLIRNNVDDHYENSSVFVIIIYLIFYLFTSYSCLRHFLFLKLTLGKSKYSYHHILILKLTLKGVLVLVLESESVLKAFMVGVLLESF